MKSPYDPPRAPIDEASRTSAKPPPTVGFLIGGLVQFGLGGFFLLRGVLAKPADVSIFGLFLVFLGIRTVVKYRARTKQQPK